MPIWKLGIMDTYVNKKNGVRDIRQLVYYLTYNGNGKIETNYF
jgi:hypothetical protein